MTFAIPVVVVVMGSYTGSMKLDRQTVARDLFASPLAWASYLAWAAVWLSVSPLFGQPDADFPALADGLLFALLLSWMGCLVDERIPRRVYDVFLVALTLLTALSLWFVPGSATPILLILLATQFTNRLPTPLLVLALITLNLYFGGVMMGPWEVGPRRAGLSMVGFAGFQLFAVLVMRYAQKAERMAEDLQSVNARLLATRSLLGETARDQERLRLSRELHDVAGHKLTALKLNLRALGNRMDDAVGEEVERAAALADELLQDLRSVVRHLRATEGIDLAESLCELSRPLPRPRLELDLDDNARIPRADQAEALLRVVQEALTNAARHGPAVALYVHLTRRSDELVLTIEDDGRVAGGIRPGNGLIGMRERLSEVDGSLEIARSDRGGLRLVATLPVELT